MTLFSFKSDLKQRILCQEGIQNALSQLEQLDKKILENLEHSIGYPGNFAFNLDEFFSWWKNSPLSHILMNEVGDPQDESTYILNVHSYEREVLHYFAKLYHIPNNLYWGYITSGGTQGNEQGLYLGREVLRRHGLPTMYFSEDSHYTVETAAKLLNIEYCVIRSQPNGEIDYSDFIKQLKTDRPALICLNIGTTIKGAVDNIEEVTSIIEAKPTIPAVHYHADAALFGGYLPFIQDPKAPQINFTKYPFGSIAVSGHKFFGSPVPNGIFLTTQRLINTLESEFIEYIESKNFTLPCSRSTLNTLIFWWTMTTCPEEKFHKEALKILEVAQYLYEELQKRHYTSWRNPFSNIVYFRSPSEKVCHKWSLPQIIDRHLGAISHIVVMQHVGKDKINAFLLELDEGHQGKTPPLA